MKTVLQNFHKWEYLADMHAVVHTLKMKTDRFCFYVTDLMVL